MLEDYFEKNKKLIINEIENSEFKHTAKVLFNFYMKSESIYSAISSIDFNAEFYPCIILLRCQIEHFLVATYIWIQFRITNKDDVARTYNEEYLIYEMMKRINYAKNNNIPLSSRIAVVFQKILDILTNKKILKQRDLEKLNIKANQFDIRKISKFCDNNLPFEYDNIVKPTEIKTLLEYYNYYSSFVHGGPSADAMTSEEYKKTIVSEAGDFLKQNSILVGFQRLYILYFLSMKNEDIKKEFQREMDKLVETSV